MRQIASASAGAASLSITRVVRIVAVMGPRCPRRLHEGNELYECKRFEILSRMALSPVHVRTFSEVVRQASFSRAAERLHLSQPAVSHHIRHLELALGARLLERAGRRAFPTHAGELLLEHAGRALAELEAARQAIQRLRGVVAGRVRLGTGATASTYLFPDPLPRLPAQRRPAAGGHGAGQRGGDQAAGGGGARRVGHLRRRRARRATRADADGARAGAAAGAPPGHRAPARQAADAGARRGAGRARRRGRLMTDPTARRRSILWRTRFANLFGAVMAFVYFRFIDPVTSGPGVTWIEIVFSVAAVTALMIIGARFNARWAVPMLTQPGSTEARRRALLFPWAMAGSTLSAWVVAGVIFGVVGPL